MQTFCVFSLPLPPSDLLNGLILLLQPPGHSLCLWHMLRARSRGPNKRVRQHKVSCVCYSSVTRIPVYLWLQISDPRHATATTVGLRLTRGGGARLHQALRQIRHQAVQLPIAMDVVLRGSEPRAATAAALARLGREGAASCFGNLADVAPFQLLAWLLESSSFPQVPPQ